MEFHSFLNIIALIVFYYLGAVFVDISRVEREKVRGGIKHEKIFSINPTEDKDTYKIVWITWVEELTEDVNIFYWRKSRKVQEDTKTEFVNYKEMLIKTNQTERR